MFSRRGIDLKLPMVIGPLIVCILCFLHLPPANEVYEDYVFTGVHKRVSASGPGRCLPHPVRHPLPSACWDTHTPAQCMLGYGKQAGGMHLTGMHSCFN